MSQPNTTVVQFPTKPAAPVVPSSTSMTPEKLVERYVLLRDKVAEIKKSHTEQLAKYHEVMDKIENMLMDALNTAGVESMRAEAGTFFKVNHTDARVGEWAKVLEYIKENDAYELLEARVSKTAALAIMQETNKPIPGVTVSNRITLSVRRGT